MTDERIAEIATRADVLHDNLGISEDVFALAQLLGHDLPDLIAALREARAALSGRTVSCGHCNDAAADTRRLDWLESKGFETHTAWHTNRSMAVHAWGSGSGKFGWTARFISSEFTNARDAIDAAMQQEADNGSL